MGCTEDRTGRKEMRRVALQLLRLLFATRGPQNYRGPSEEPQLSLWNAGGSVTEEKQKTKKQKTDVVVQNVK